MEPTFAGDTRFYPGYHWVYEENPMIGLCLKGETPEQAIEVWAERFRRMHHMPTCTITMFSLAGPNAEPVRHFVAVGHKVDQK